jgi:hypothetical protein
LSTHHLRREEAGVSWIKINPCQRWNSSSASRLGAYLLALSSQKIIVQLTGWGLIAYALAFAIQIIFNQFILIILLGPAL